MTKPVLWAVEDSKPMQETLIHVFTELGCQVVGFPNAEKALEKLNAGEKPDVIILDFLLPGMSGPQFYRKIITDNKLRTIPIVPYTGQLHEKGSVVVDEWMNLVSSNAKSEQGQAPVFRKDAGNKLRVSEHVIMAVANHLRSAPCGIPRPFQDAILDLLNIFMKPYSEIVKP